MQIHRRWLAVVVPIVVVGLIEVASDSFLDPKLPFPRDTILVMVVVSVLAIVYGRYAFGRSTGWPARCASATRNSRRATPRPRRCTA